ncbi:hypothetical protein MP228_006350 [Amoeboaphelidium protococcarum]|nr:hypothetical protein MP228_006350 [Amoeboaphelidium protococcarum]
MTGSIIKDLSEQLLNVDQPLATRFRALFSLKALKTDVDAVQAICAVFDEKRLKDGVDGALLKHEVAYCLGQMANNAAIPTLARVLKDQRQDSMVRHEAAEALGAIGCNEFDGLNVVDLLSEYLRDDDVVVSQTCELALQKINCPNNDKDIMSKSNTFTSIDPAPAYPIDQFSVEQLKARLLDRSQPLFERYRAMFTLRNIGSDEAVLALADGLSRESSCETVGGSESVQEDALFRHEIAYVFGQMRHPASVPALKKSLSDLGEVAMVRHEAAEALGSIAEEGDSQDVYELLRDKTNLAGESVDVVRDSCVVAIDMYEYEKDCNQFNFTRSQQPIGQ